MDTRGHSRKKSSRKKRSESLYRKNSKMFIFIVTVIVLTVSGVIASMGIMRKKTAGHKYIYLKTPLASQTPLDTLFVPEDSDGWKEEELFQKLHIMESDLDIEINSENIEHFMGIIEAVYQDGNREAEENIILSEEESKTLKAARRKVKNSEPHTAAEYESEAESWYMIYRYTNRPVALYHSSRCMRDFLETGLREPFDKCFEIAAEAVYRLETFLEMGDRNINSEEEPIWIHANKGAFESGKTYLHLVRSAMAGDKEQQGFMNCFLMLAYACMRHAKNMMTEDNRDYVKVLYYIGNVGEKMTCRIPRNSVLYEQIKNEALQHYSEAQWYLDQKPGYYYEEESMRENIENGIETLNGR